MNLRLTFAALVALTVLLSSCSRDPEVRKKKFLANGNKYYESGKFREASIMYRNALKEDARYGEAYYRVALTAMKLGNYGEAVPALQRAVELQPDNLDAHRNLSDIWIVVYSQNPKKFANIKKELDELAARMVKQHPKAYETLRLQGLLAQFSEKPGEALPFYEAADKAKPGEPEMQINIAAMLLGLDRAPEAEAVLKRLVEKSKTYLRGYDLLYALYRRQDRKADGEALAILRVTNNPSLIDARLALATHYGIVADIPKVEATLADILKDEAKFPNAYEKVGAFQARMGQFDKSVATFQQGIAKSNNDAVKKTLRKGIIEVYTAQDKITEAQALADQMLKEDPKDPEAISIRAHLWLKGGKRENLDAAIADLQSVVSKLPENFVLRYDLGSALLVRGDYEASKVQLQEALKLRPDFLPARTLLAQISIQKQEWAGALQYANDVLEKDPNNLAGRLIRSNALMAQGDVPTAKALLTETIKLYPNNKDAMHQLGFLAFKEKNYKQAEEYFKGVYNSTPPDIRGMMGLIETYLAQDNYPAAIKIVDGEIEKYPKNLAFQVARGTIAIRAGKYDEAIAYFQKVAKEQNNVHDLYMRLAEAQRLKGDIPAALESWKKASEIKPDYIPALLNRATTLDGVLKRSAEARPIYDQVLRIQPDNGVALNNLAYLMAEDGNELDAALTLAQRAKQKFPNDPMIADTLGWIYIKKGLANNAISIFEDLTAKNPKVAVFHYHLAMAQSQRGDKIAAKRALDNALKANPQKQELEDIKKLAAKIG